MSKQNVELVRRGIESVEAFWALLDEHVVWDMREMPLPGSLRRLGRARHGYRGLSPLLGHVG